MNEAFLNVSKVTRLQDRCRTSSATVEDRQAFQVCQVASCGGVLPQGRWRCSAHPVSHVTLWLSSGKFASGSDFKGGAFFLKGGAFFVGILPPLIFREMMQKPTPFFLPPLIIFGKKRAPLNNWKHFYCPPEFCPAFWKPPLKLNGDLKPLLVPPWFCFGIFKAPLKVEKQNKCPP